MRFTKATDNQAKALLALAGAILALLALAPNAGARTTRAYQSSIGSFTSFGGPKNLAVDQASGDVYAADSGKVFRFTAAGAPHNFTAGPDAGTNTLTGLSPFSTGSTAIDNSGGPLNGTVYVANGDTVKAYAASGAGLGAITAPASAVAVDQTDGSLYVGGFSSGIYTVYRFAPNSPSGVIDNADYTVSGITIFDPFALAADAGKVYVAQANGSHSGPGTLRRYSATDFTPGLPAATGTQIDDGVDGVAVDPKDGDVYSDHGNGVSVFDSAGTFLYRFGAAAYFGAVSAGIAVKSAASGPAAKAYVADSYSEHQIDVFGALSKVPTYTHPTLAAFGPDGSGSSSFGFGSPQELGFDATAKRLYAIDSSVPGIYGFDAAAPPAFPPLGAFDPLGTVSPFGIGGQAAGLAVDNTALASAGNLYMASRSTNLLYGWDSSGASLAGFPIDPATTPGAPNGSPKDLCGAAVDASGNVWVSNSSSKKVLKYSSAGVYLSSIDTSAQGGGPCHIALDSAANLYADIGGSGVWKYTAASSYATATHLQGGAPGNGAQTHSLAVDPANDHLFVADWFWVDEYDPAANLVDEFATDVPGANYNGVAVDPANGDVYLADKANRKIRALGPGLILPETRTAATGGIDNDSATLNGFIGTQNLPLGDCHFDYVAEPAFYAGGFGDLSSGGTAPCTPAAGSIPLDLDQHAVSAPATGLQPNTTYRYRLSATNAQGTSTAQGSFTTTGPAQAETTGSPIRTTTTAQLTGRVYPVRAAATYHFEYGDQGPCDSNPCASTPDRPAGSADQYQLVAEQIGGLSPDTTYRYRVIADNGNPAGPAAGADMTVTTRASDKPLSHGHFPGPPGSDRAYEQVSISNSGGNPVGFAQGFADNGDAAAYSIAGGTPISNSGSFWSLYYAARPPGEHPTQGWQTKLTTPARADLAGADWSGFFGAGDLSSTVSANGLNQQGPLWRLSPDGAPQRLFAPVPPQQFSNHDPFRSPYGVSADGSRTVAFLKGGVIDPDHPAAASVDNIYDVSTDPPRLLSLMPGGAPACGVSAAGVFNELGAQATHWVSDDGSLVFFYPAGCGSGLYVRDVPAAQTTLIGPISLVKATPGAVFGTTGANLDPARDRSDGGNDLYRYDLTDQSFSCLSCQTPGLDANVAGSSPTSVAVSDDGSRAYFSTTTKLLPGAPPNGTSAIYRVKAATGDLAYVAPGGNIGSNQNDVNLSADGSRFAFGSDAAALDPLGAATNAGTFQYYLYDDTDRSLSCVSCPQDAGAPAAGVPGSLFADVEEFGHPNLQALANDGTLAFETSTPLIGADQNTPGPGGNSVSGVDVYEWRDGRQLLVTDGLSSWAFAPSVEGISPSGRDVYFAATARYTADALDDNRRLYDARIGGGIDFPAAPQPCPLEVCQGTPKGAPEDPAPGSGSFAGPEDPTPVFLSRCRKGKVRRHGRCVSRRQHKQRSHKKHHHRAAGRNGRAHR